MPSGLPPAASSPKGRDEDGLAFAMSSVRHRDRYTEGYFVDPAEKYEPPKSSAGSCCSGERHSSCTRESCMTTEKIN
jgi:hypothetical protein